MKTTMRRKVSNQMSPNMRPSIRFAMGLLSVFSLLFLAAPTKAATDSDKPTLEITFDDTAIRELIALVKAKDSSDASLDTWLNLPANKYILSVGDAEENLTREHFRANAVAEINGTATPQTQSPTDIGCLWMSSTQDYTAMLNGFEDSAEARIRRIADRLAKFCPPGTHIKETVYLHLGGDWDAVNDNGDIYVNIRFWHDLHRPSWDGINMIVAHESMHTVQNMAYGNPRDNSGATQAFVTAMSKIQREGTARYVENDTDPEAYETSSYGFYERAITSETYRSFARDMKKLEIVYTACFPKYDLDKFTDAYVDGVDTGGPFYDVGYGMARAIDERLGRRRLIATVMHGPKDFFAEYAGLCSSDSSLPKLPEDILKAVADMPDKLPDSAAPAQPVKGEKNH